MIVRYETIITNFSKGKLKEIKSLLDLNVYEQFNSSLKERGLNVSRATVYRTLDILIKYNFIRKMDIEDGRIRYETKINHPHHDHMICIECGQITEFLNDEIERLQDKVCDNYSFKLIRHIHQLFGKCSEC